MSEQLLTEVWNALQRFGIEPDGLELIAQNNADRAVWHVRSPQGDWALKALRSWERAHKVAAVSRFLHQGGASVAPALDAVDGTASVFSGDFSFLLFPWIEGRNPRYEEGDVIERMAAALARFHLASRGYADSGGPPPENWLDWEQLYRKEAAKLERVLQQADVAADSTALTLRACAPWLRKRIRWTLDRAPATALRALVRAARRDPLIGHLDFARHNVLVSVTGDLTVIDLDAAARALPMWDLSYLITCMNHDLRGWSGERFQRALGAYEAVNPFSEAERDLLLLDQVFPHQAILLGVQYVVRNSSARLSDEIERCLDLDRGKLADVGLGPL